MAPCGGLPSRKGVAWRNASQAVKDSDGEDGLPRFDERRSEMEWELGNGEGSVNPWTLIWCFVAGRDLRLSLTLRARD